MVAVAVDGIAVCVAATAGVVVVGGAITAGVSCPRTTVVENSLGTGTSRCHCGSTVDHCRDSGVDRRGGQGNCCGYCGGCTEGNTVAVAVAAGAGTGAGS